MGVHLVTKVCLEPVPRIYMYIYIYILDSHRRLTAPVKPHEAKFEAVQPAEQ